MSNIDLSLHLQGISKSFGATQALKNVDLQVRKGEVHALIGENGAGKSTLMKILSGAIKADKGSIVFHGKPTEIQSPASARDLGIAMIYQELTLAPHLTAEENVTLGMEKSRFGFIRNERVRIRQALDLLHHSQLPLRVPTGRLGIAQQQIVEIARALVSNASVIIMDEPTSSLTSTDTQALFEAIAQLRKTGISIIYISHFLEEVFQIADSYTVLRDGETVGCGALSETDIPHIIELMVGRKLDEMFPRQEHPIGEPVMKVRNLQGVPLPNDVSFDLHAGEILGIAGLVGAGRSETMRRIFGLDRSHDGVVEVKDFQPFYVNSIAPRTALHIGIDLLSEDRKVEGLATSLSIRANTTLSSLKSYGSLRGFGFLNLRKERDSVNKWIRDVGIRCKNLDQQISGLSGGNQQKVALARILEHGSNIILLDEPTRGVDVGSKVEIYRLIGQLAAQGKAIVFVSSYLPELLGICDTLGVMHRGRLSPIRPIRDWTEQEIMRVATSGV